MTKREAEVVYNMINAMRSAGISYEDGAALRRISLTLKRWNEHECNGAIQRDEETGIPYWYNTESGKRLYRAPDRERGAQKRLSKIMAKYPTLTAYEQTDPRGAALYILRPSDILPGHEIGSYYSRGIAVY